MLKDKEQNRDTSREAEVEWNTREIVDILDSWLHN